MSETIGPFTVDAAEGILIPANGIVKVSIDPAPPVYDSSMASGVPSRIRTVRAFTTAAAALTEALNYRTAVGVAVVFRGVACFVANVEPDHRSAYSTGTGPGIATAEWTIVATLGWTP